MGQGTSKPAPSSMQHVFSSDTPVRFSQEVIDALQNSAETDSTRAKDLELHIQSRVHAELQRLEAAQDAALKELSEKISASPSSQSPQQPQQDQQTQELSRASVQKEIDALKAKLAKRRMREEVVGDKGVERAKEEMVSCLRVNDRRPLDCWREVEAFKREVGRLEGAFLGRVLE